MPFLGLPMHMKHTTPLMDACHLRIGQHVLMASGRAAQVCEIDQATIKFRYLGSANRDDCVVILRHRVPELVRV